jgi:hypothetical protein
MRRLQRRLLVFHHRDSPLSRGDSSAENRIIGKDLAGNRAILRGRLDVKRGLNGGQWAITGCREVVAAVVELEVRSLTGL